MKKTSPVTIFLAFLVVAVPLGWGLYRSIITSKSLFVAPAAAAPPAATAPAPAPAK